VTIRISAGYLAEQQRLHQQPAYGSRGYNWGYMVAGIARIEECRSILDYGAGKGTLTKTLTRSNHLVQAYDPAVNEFAAQPSPADLVVCVDVLEHIEPACLDGVLGHLAKLTKKILFVAISMREAKRQLSDGRNAHVLIQSGPWWREQLEQRGFTVRRVWPHSETNEWVAMLERT